jgi:hypothetical protein
MNLRCERRNKVRHALNLHIHGITSFTVKEELRRATACDVKCRVPQQIPFEDISHGEFA